MKKSTYLHHIVNCNIKNGYRVSYCCLKDNPFDVGIKMIAEKAHVNAEYIKRGLVSEDDWIRLTNSQVSSNNENMALIPYSESSKSDSILSIVENSGAEIVVIDDFNGILLRRCLSAHDWSDIWLADADIKVLQEDTVRLCSWFRYLLENTSKGRECA